MKYTLTIILSILFMSSGYAQVPVIQWQKSFGGSGQDIARTIQKTADGGYIVAGLSYSNDGDVSGNHGSADGWIVKTDDVGTIQWQKSLGGTSFDGALNIRQTTDGGYIIAGASRSNNGDVTGNHGGQDYWIVKISDTGAIQWQKSLGGSGDDGALAIQQTTDGGYIAAGASKSSDGNVTGNHGNYDFWVVKLNDTGSIQWQRSLGGTGDDEALGIRQTTDGGYIVAGFSQSNNGDVLGNHGLTDSWIVKLNDTGAMQWQRCYGGSSNDYANAIRQTADGGYIVAGESSSNDGEVSGNHGSYDYWVVKINDTGAIQWQKSLGGSGDDEPYDIQITADGGYVVAGSSSSNDGDVSGNHGGGDYWAVKLNDTGTIQWQISMGGSGSDLAYPILQTGDGGYIVAGQSYSHDGDVTGNHGNADYWIVKLSCGLSAGAISGDTAVCLATAITLSDTAAGGVWSISNGHASIAGSIVTGITAGTDTVIYTKTNTCGTAVVSFPLHIISCPEEVNQTTAALVSIIPNPTNGDIFIKGASGANIRVYNMLGQLMTTANKTDHVSISALTAGMYFVRVFNAQGTLIKQDKVVKE